VRRDSADPSRVLQTYFNGSTSKARAVGEDEIRGKRDQGQQKNKE